MSILTEFELSLPHGYLDADGTVHKEGVMRLATAMDEILPMRDPRVQGNPGYLAVILFSRVLLRLGTLPLHRHQYHRETASGRYGFSRAFLRKNQRF